MMAGNMVRIPAVAERRRHLAAKVISLLLLLALAATGCAGLTAREKGALVGGTGGAAGGALLGAAAGNAALGAAIGGPVGLLGGYLVGDHFFQDDAARKRSSSGVGGYSSSRASARPKSGARAPVESKSTPGVQGGEDAGGRVF